MERGNFASVTSVDDDAARWAARSTYGEITSESRAELAEWLAADRRHRGAYLRAQAGLYAMEHAIMHGPPVRVADADVALRPSNLNRRSTVRWVIGMASGDIITSISRNELLNLCVDLPSIENRFCDRIQRNDDQYAMWVDTSVINASVSESRGIDLGANYRFDVGQGEMTLALRASYLLQFETITPPDIETSVIVYDGGYQNPRFRSTLFANYRVGDWNLGLDTRYWSSAKNYPDAKTSEEYDDYQGGGGVYDVYGRFFFGSVKFMF